jgi:RNA polymerase sigma-70 factor, ECF subfamily
MSIDPKRPDSIKVLLDRASSGDSLARQQLLARHREQLLRMVARRIDSRVAARIDASDVVQDALIEANRKLDAYLRDRPLPFFPWLCRLAFEHIRQMHRHHLGTQMRAVAREVTTNPGLADDSSTRLLDRLIASGTSPSAQMVRQEQVGRALQHLGRLAPNEREILVMRYLDDLSFAEIAATLGISEDTAKIRHYRALVRIRGLFERGE